MYKKMPIFFLLTTVVLIVMQLNGCSFTTPVTGKEYQPSFSSVDILTELRAGGHAINVADFTASKELDKSIKCWAVNIFPSPDGNTTFAKYAHDALVQELRHAKLYSSSSTTTLKANLDQLAINDDRSGAWKLVMTFDDGVNPSYTITEQYNFYPNVGFMDGGKVCFQAAEAYNTAVQHLLLKLYQSTEFKKTIKKK